MIGQHRIEGPDPILFVDDDPAVRETFVRMANRLGFSVHSAACGEEAISLACENRYSVVVTDLQLPEIDGLSLIGRLRSIQSGAKFLVLTGLDNPGRARLDTSVVDIMPKPLDLSRLQDSLNMAVRFHRKETPGAGGSVRLLVVEDNLADRVLYSRYLRSEIANLIVHSVDCAGAAANSLAHENFDAILCDLNLPDAHGLEIVDRLMDSHSNLPLIVLSNSQNENLAIEALHRGAQDFLVKSEVCAVSLGRSLRFALARKAHESPRTKRVSQAG